MSQNSKSADIDAPKTATSIDSVKSKTKKRSGDTEELSKDFKKPRKSLKQSSITETIIRSNKALPPTPPTQQINNTPCLVTREDIGRIETTLERIIGQQDTARASIDRLLEIFTREVQELSSDEDVPPKAYKER